MESSNTSAILKKTRSNEGVESTIPRRRDSTESINRTVSKDRKTFSQQSTGSSPTQDFPLQSNPTSTTTTTTKARKSASNISSESSVERTPPTSKKNQHKDENSSSSTLQKRASVTSPSAFEYSTTSTPSGRKSTDAERSSSEEIPLATTPPKAKSHVKKRLVEIENEGAISEGEDEILNPETKLARERERIKREEEKLRKEELSLQQQQQALRGGPLSAVFSDVFTALSSNGKSSDFKTNLEKTRNEKEKYIQDSLESIRKAKEDLLRESQKYYRLRFDQGYSDTDDLMTGWMKMRDPFKVWHLRWFVLRPGKLLYYKSDLEKLCQGIVILNGCEVHKRQTKMEGYCFKILHPKQNNIYSSRGLKGETLVSAMVPLSAYYCILRVSIQDEQTKWMDAIRAGIAYTQTDQERKEKPSPKDLITRPESVNSVGSVNSVSSAGSSSQLTSGKEEKASVTRKKKKTIRRTLYLLATDNRQPKLDILHSGEEDVAPEFRSVLVHMLKQVKIGMDLSRVTLPTFILEPRSTLEKISDWLNHAQLLADAVKIKDPLQRMIQVCKWYVSGFYIRPKGVKKPYNPILGEHFRCSFKHPNGSETYFVAEQVSHHPPVSAFYASNRKEGYVINCSILFRSKFLGTYIASILDGSATVYLCGTDEEYELTFPTAKASGFLTTLVLELVGNVHIRCNKTGYSVDLDLKPKPFFGGEYNAISGKIKKEKEVLYNIYGKWDERIYIKKEGDPNKDFKGDILWEVTPETVTQRLPLYKPAWEQMEDFESDKLWSKVSQAILSNDQSKATDEKFVIEQAQREAVKERQRLGITWQPKLFIKDNESENGWTYKYMNKKPWDSENETFEYEFNGVISSLEPGTVVEGEGEDLDEDTDNEEEEEEEDETTAYAEREILQHELEDDEPIENSKWKKAIEERFSKLEKELLMIWQRQKTDDLRNSNFTQKSSSHRRPLPPFKTMFIYFCFILFVYFVWSIHQRLSELEKSLQKKE